MLSMEKAPVIRLVLFLLNQQLPILPGRFQPSTFGVCELNYRVRHGTGVSSQLSPLNLRVCSLKTIQKKFRRLFQAGRAFVKLS